MASHFKHFFSNKIYHKAPWPLTSHSKETESLPVAIILVIVGAAVGAIRFVVQKGNKQ